MKQKVKVFYWKVKILLMNIMIMENGMKVRLTMMAKSMVKGNSSINQEMYMMDSGKMEK